MNKTFIALTIVATLTATLFLANYGNSQESGEYEAFIAGFSRNYQSEQEYEFRQNIFQKNVDYINEFNSEDHTWTLGVNNFADMTKEEFKGLMSLQTQGDNDENALGEISATEDSSSNEAELDWVARGYLSDVKNQGSCGSCWAFSANAAVEAAYVAYRKIKFDETVAPPVLSEQHLVDCDPYSGGCLGGAMLYAFYYYRFHCPILEADYKYTATDNECRSDNKPCATDKLLGYYRINRNNDASMRHALNLSPISVSIKANNDAFRFYSTGVISGEECGYDLDHGVVITGSHSEKLRGADVKVWSVRNSWGSDWGEDGYLRIQRQVINVEGRGDVGVCGINQQNTLPTFVNYFS